MGKGIVKGAEKAPARALLNALGMQAAEIEKPLVGIISAFNGLTPGNSALSAVCDMLKFGITAAGGTAVTLPSPSLCDGLSAGNETGGFSLAARETIADCVEMLLRNNPLDAAILVPSGDLVTAGMIMGAARADIPVLVCGGGPVSPSVVDGQRTSLLTVYETMGKVAAGKGSSAELNELEANAAGGSYGDAYGESSFGCLAEALGIALTGNGTIPAGTAERKKFAHSSGTFVLELLEKNLIFKKLITADAVKNALAVCTALGGNTNNILHLLAIASELKINISADELDKITSVTPVLVSLAPVGKAYIVDLHTAGGVPALMAELDKKTLIKKAALTVHGDIGSVISGKETTDEKVLRSADNPYAGQPLYVLRGSLADGGCLAKIPLGFENMKFTGTARVFNTVDECCSAIKQKKIKAGDCLVIRYIGPKGAPGMKEVTMPAAMLFGAGLSNTVAIVTDGRIPEGTRGLAVGHVTPEAEYGETLALVEDDDKIEIDLVKGKINVFISSKDLGARRKKWKPRDITAKGALLRYAAHVGDAWCGAGLKTKV